MLQLRNDTGLAAAVFASPDIRGVDSLYTVVKGTFDLSRGLALAEEQAPVAMMDEYHGEPGQSSIRVAADIALVKPATDVLLLGHAYAPGGRPAFYTDVSLVVGPVHKVVRVFGDRTWMSSGVGYSISTPEPFERVPLVWERAYGGTDATGDVPAAEPRNPVGAGFRARDDGTLDGLPLPNLEDPYDPITSWKQRPAPAGFAPVAPHWEPRRSFAGTYDAAWQEKRAPYLPQDFDVRFFQVAPPGLVAPGYLQGGEPVEVRGATPDGLLSFRLPQVSVETTYVVDGSRVVRPAPLDTVIIEPDAQRVILVWRSSLDCDRKLLRVRQIEVALHEAA